MVPSLFMISTMTEEGSKPSKPGQITSGLGMPCPAQHATRLSHDGKDVPWLNNISGLRRSTHRHTHRVCSICGGNTGRDSEAASMELVNLV